MGKNINEINYEWINDKIAEFIIYNYEDEMTEEEVDLISDYDFGDIFSDFIINDEIVFGSELWDLLLKNIFDFHPDLINDNISYRMVGIDLLLQLHKNIIVAECCDCGNVAIDIPSEHIYEIQEKCAMCGAGLP